jgi:hypothetical protein
LRTLQRDSGTWQTMSGDEHTSQTEECPAMRLGGEKSKIPTRSNELARAKDKHCCCQACGSFLALKQRQRGELSPSHEACPPRYMKDRKTRKRSADAIYVRSDGYRQAEDQFVLSKTLRVCFKSGHLASKADLNSAMTDCAEDGTVVFN